MTFANVDFFFAFSLVCALAALISALPSICADKPGKTALSCLALLSFIMIALALSGSAPGGILGLSGSAPAGTFTHAYGAMITSISSFCMAAFLLVFILRHNPRALEIA